MDQIEKFKTKIVEDYVKILTNTSIIINRVATLLYQKNIPTRVKDNVESARLAGFGVPQNDVELYVPESELSNAGNIIADFNKEK